MVQQAVRTTAEFCAADLTGLGYDAKAEKNLKFRLLVHTQVKKATIVDRKVYVTLNMGSLDGDDLSHALGILMCKITTDVKNNRPERRHHRRAANQHTFAGASTSTA